MAKYICSNCGEVLNSNGTGSGCGTTFWTICLICTILIGLFVPVALIAVLFEILFIILCSGSNKTNCHFCKAQNSIVPINSTRGMKLYKEYKEKFEKKDAE